MVANLLARVDQIVGFTTTSPKRCTWRRRHLWEVVQRRPITQDNQLQAVIFRFACRRCQARGSLTLLSTELAWVMDLELPVPEAVTR